MFAERMQELGKVGVERESRKRGKGGNCFVSDLGGGKIIIFLLYFGPCICILLFFDPIALAVFGVLSVQGCVLKLFIYFLFFGKMLRKERRNLLLWVLLG